MEPEFSIISVVLDDLPGLLRTRRSIRAQGSRGFEWVVIDGGSTDGTRQFLRTLDAGGVRWVSGPDSGIYDAMNRGIDLSRGRYVVFMNAGDTFSDSFVLKRVGDRLRSGGRPPDVLFGGATLMLPGGGRVYRAPTEIGGYIWHGLPANHQATYYRSDRVKRTHYDDGYALCGDYYLIAKLFAEGIDDVAYLDSSLADFRVGDRSYRDLRRLFLEPYAIQATVLGEPLRRRLASLARRFVSTCGLIALSQPALAPTGRLFARGSEAIPGHGRPEDDAERAAWASKASTKGSEATSAYGRPEDDAQRAA